MSLIPCSRCARRNVGPLAHTYWFAPVPNGDVLRVRQRLCPECLERDVEQFLTPDDAELLACPVCGISTEEDVDAVYVTYYPKGGEPVRGAMALCHEHALTVRRMAAEGAKVLEDRYVEPADYGVAAPVRSAEAVATALGLNLRPLTARARNVIDGRKAEIERGEL